MTKGKKRQIDKEIAALARLKDADINTSDIPEVQDWSKAMVGRFYRPEHASGMHSGDVRSALLEKQTSKLPLALYVKSQLNKSTALDGPYGTLTNSELMTVCTEESTSGAWQEFIRRFDRFIVQVVTRIARSHGNVSPDTVQDLVQDVLLKIISDNFHLLREFSPRHENSLPGYLKVVAANVAYDHFRMLGAHKRGAEDTVELNQQTQTGLAPEQNVKDAVLLGEIEQILKTGVSERERHIFWLHYRDGLTAQEIASIPGIDLTVKGVGSLLRRLRQFVRSKLTNEHSDYFENRIS